MYKMHNPIQVHTETTPLISNAINTYATDIAPVPEDLEASPATINTVITAEEARRSRQYLIRELSSFVSITPNPVNQIALSTALAYGIATTEGIIIGELGNLWGNVFPPSELAKMVALGNFYLTLPLVLLNGALIVASHSNNRIYQDLLDPHFYSLMIGVASGFGAPFLGAYLYSQSELGMVECMGKGLVITIAAAFPLACLFGIAQGIFNSCQNDRRNQHNEAAIPPATNTRRPTQ